MLQALRTFFDRNLADGANADPEHRLRLAAAALLFEVSRSDFSVDARELDRIRDVVKNYFDLTPDETDALLELAEREANDATSLHGFTSLITENWSIDQRVRLCELMWPIAYADGRLDDNEVHLMRKIERLLYVPHKEFIGAKLRARQDIDT